MVRNNNATTATSVSARFLGCVLILSIAIGAANAVAIKQQNPCTQDANGACVAFSELPSALTIRSYQFVLTGPSDVLFNFVGSMYCTSPHHPQEVDVLSQIVKTSSATVEVNGPSSLRHVLTLAESDPLGQGVNLGTSRVIHYSSGGTKAVSYRLAAISLPLDPFTCYVTNAAFNIVVSP